MDEKDANVAKKRRYCPKCGSRHYERGCTVDLYIIHEKDGKVHRRIEHVGYPWFFKCLDCGYEDNDY